MYYVDNIFYYYFSAKLEEVQASKDRDHKYYTDQITRLQQEIAKYQKVWTGAIVLDIIWIEN